MKGRKRNQSCYFDQKPPPVSSLVLSRDVKPGHQPVYLCKSGGSLETCLQNRFVSGQRRPGPGRGCVTDRRVELWLSKAATKLTVRQYASRGAGGGGEAPAGAGGVREREGIT